MERLDAALAEWRDAVGTRHVVSTGTALQQAALTTYATRQKVSAIIRPKSRREVQACVRIAAIHGVALYPVSTGKNWGYGSRVPARDGGVVLDLGRLDGIVDYNEELAYVTVEPGVTQNQLRAYLRQRGGRLWMDGTGSTPHASPLGNTLERGFGVTPYGDHVGRACAYEVVLANGDVLHTGFGAYPGARVAPIDRWAPGPQLDGLFSQSPFGVVTRMTIPLMPAPDVAQTAMWDMPDDPSLLEAVDVLRRLQLEGTVRAAPWFANHYRVMATVSRFPWTRYEPPLLPEPARRLARGFGIAPWTGTVAVYGTASQVRSTRQRLREALAGRVQALTFVDEQVLSEAPATGRRSVQLAMHRAYTGDFLNAVRRAYWRKRQTPSADADPDRDGVGFVFVNASIPFVGREVVAAARMAEEVVIDQGFEPAVSCHSIRERVLQLLATIVYDRGVEGDDERAQAAHDELALRWAARGWYPFRLGLHSMALYEHAEPSWRTTLASLEQALDPLGILAPGRYCG